ncbi:hypothetical protein [Trinickia sp. Y13]|uniref:hypothetical protein n=1 Tax=Trinickia sp. Y13 TaxID=2917807 RepID=UPI002404C2D1|nr:hypothetical protein [Trinickia sp. Y13]MDG0024220.1 hypothetical protein [Trinickia sp. Y13]
MPLAPTPMESIATDRDTAIAAQVRAALRELFLVSGAAAQLGAHGQRVQDAQWQALARAMTHASAVLGARDRRESEPMASFRRLAGLCDELLGRRALGHVCPSALWRDLARAGREAYEQIDA